MTDYTLVTGASRNIGRAIATRLKADGQNILMLDIMDPEDPSLGEFRKTDLSSTTDTAQAMAWAMGDGRRITRVVNCAGIVATGKVEDVTTEDFERVMAINVRSYIEVMKAVVPGMKAAGRGAVVFTSSTAGIYGYPNRAPYAAAKWAIIGLMKTVAMEAGPFGVRANAICPGAVEGPRMEGVLAREAAAKGMTRDQVYDGYASGTSMRSFVEAKDIADMAVFLGSDAARRVSGQVIAVDGHTENPDPKL